MKLDKYQKCVEACDKAIEQLVRGNVENRGYLAKAYFRRGRAWLALKEVDKARTDATEASKIDPQDVGVVDLVRSLDEIDRKYDEEQKRAFRGVFQ